MNRHPLEERAEQEAERALSDPATRTKDIRGTGGTNDMTRAIVAAIETEK